MMRDRRSDPGDTSWQMAGEKNLEGVLIRPARALFMQPSSGEGRAAAEDIRELMLINAAQVVNFRIIELNERASGARAGRWRDGTRSIRRCRGRGPG